MLANANEAALSAWVATLGKPPTKAAAVLLEAAYTAARALDQDVAPCEECRQRGTPALPSTLAEYRRTLDSLAGALAEAGGEHEATELRLAGGVRS